MTDGPAGRPKGMSVDDVAALLRGAPDVAPPSVTSRAVTRVRVESTAMILLRTLGGSWLRIARAVPDLLVAPRDAQRDDDLEDTGELPRPPA